MNSVKREAAEVLEEAGTALEEAAEEVIGSDDLLVKEEAQQVAAQVSSEHPLGVPGKPLGERSPVRFGFATGIGLLLAAAAGALVVVAGHILVLVLIAALVAVGLEPVVAFLCRLGYDEVWLLASSSLPGSLSWLSLWSNWSRLSRPKPPRSPISYPGYCTTSRTRTRPSAG